MSGVTEVRLFRNTVDTVPTSYTDVTAAVLNSSTKNHATGVKRYLDGVTTVSGLDPGTNYFWVELIDARGNTAGPQPVGTHTLDPPPPTVWEFYMDSIPPNYDYGIQVYQIASSTFPITPQNMTFHTHERNYPTAYDALVEIKDGTISDHINFREGVVGTKLWSITDASGSTSTTFTIHWRRQAYVPGIQIFRNGVLVLTTPNGNNSSYPEVFEVTYTIP